METLLGFVSDIPSNLKRNPQPVYNAELYHNALRYKLHKSFKYARENLGKAKMISNINYNKHLNVRKFTAKQKVWVKNPKRDKNLRVGVGPFEVTKIHSKVTVSIKGNKGKREFFFFYSNKFVMFSAHSVAANVLTRLNILALL